MSLIDALSFGFTERMAGTYRMVDGSRSGAFHFDVKVACPDLSDVREIAGDLEGRLTMEGVAEGVHARGRIELSPFWRARIGYQLSFTGADGKKYRFEGKKTIKRIGVGRVVRSWTTLPGEVIDESTGRRVADVDARFHLKEELLPLLLSVRLERKSARRAEA